MPLFMLCQFVRRRWRAIELAALLRRGQMDFRPPTQQTHSHAEGLMPFLGPIRRTLATLPIRPASNQVSYAQNIRHHLLPILSIDDTS